MSIYLVPKKGWRYEFQVKGIRYTHGFFKTKREAKEAQAQKREEIKNPDPEGPIDTTFLNLVEQRLDFVKAYNSERHYKDYVYMSRRWVNWPIDLDRPERGIWSYLYCRQITQEMIQKFIFVRKEVSPDTANKEIRYLRATFNFGIEKKLITENPTDGIDFLPVEKKIKYIPPKEDVWKVLLAADPETQDYLWLIKESLARMSEINRLIWDDVNFNDMSITLYTRKKKGGNLTPRKVAMTEKVYEILFRRYKQRDKTKPWVFWHTYVSSKTREKKEGPYQDRKKIMGTLCKKAGVKYFRFHALRHYSASILDHHKAGIGSIQRILGHEKRSTTEIYLHSIGEAEREAIKILDQENEAKNEKPHTKPHTK